MLGALSATHALPDRFSRSTYKRQCIVRKPVANMRRYRPEKAVSTIPDGQVQILPRRDEQKARNISAPSTPSICGIDRNVKITTHRLQIVCTHWPSSTCLWSLTLEPQPCVIRRLGALRSG